MHFWYDRYFVYDILENEKTILFVSAANFRQPHIGNEAKPSLESFLVVIHLNKPTRQSIQWTPGYTFEWKLIKKRLS